MKKTTMPGMPEVEVVEIKTSAPVNVLADPAPAKKPAAKRTRKTAAAKTTAAKTEAKKPAAKRGRKPKAATAAAKKAEGPKKPTALIIMDGFGHREETKGNAIEAAKKPNLDKIFAENPLTYIGASGLDVGLPDGQMGNSEVGHTNIGAGRIVYQELTRITKAIQDGDFFENPALMSAINQCKWFDSTLHIFGLLSDGGVHSHIDHMFALLELARRNGLRKVCFHCFMDGRDTPPQSGIEYIDRLQAKIDAVEVGCIATVSGRYYAMDRDNRWDRVQKAYNAIALGEGEHAATAHEAMEQSYANGVTDEFVVPVIVTEGATVKDDDAIIFANFRPDRAREITRAFVDPEFTGGAFCGVGAEERGQGEAIARCLYEFIELKTPVISIVTGEGGSGGALALAVADRVLMLENALYSVISPRGCASILWKDPKREAEAADTLHITAQDLYSFGMIEGIIQEGTSSAQLIRNVARTLRDQLAELDAEPDIDTMLQKRYEKFRRVGVFRTINQESNEGV